MPWVQYIGRRSLAGDVLGPNLVSNGHFTDGATGWIGTSATLSQTVDGKLRVTNSTTANGYGYASYSTESGVLYRLDVDVTLGTATSFFVWGSSTNTGTSAYSRDTGSTSTTITLYFVATASTSYVLLQNGSTTSGHYTDFDNVRVRKVVARGHATDIEHITNGDFDIDAQWTKGTGWAISSGVATATASSAQLINAEHDFSLFAGKSYATSFTVSSYSAGTILIGVSGSGVAEGTARSANGTYTETITHSAATAGDAFGFQTNAFTGTVDNVSVKLAANNTWSLDFDIWLPMQPGRSARTNAVQMLDSSTDTQYWSSKKTLNVQTDMMEYGEWQFMEEFIDNATDGQTVIFDPYGTESQPKDPRSYVLIGSSMTHVVGGDTTERRQYQLQFREA